MKKLLLLLVVFLGIGFSAKAQSCEVGDGTYVAAQPSINKNHQIECKVAYYGKDTPSSGTIYVTVYYTNTQGKDDSEMIFINWNDSRSDGYLWHSGTNIWKGNATNVQTIKRWKVTAGACTIKKITNNLL